MSYPDYPIPAYDSGTAERSRDRWNAIAKPLGSLGLLEQAVIRIAGLTGDDDYHIDRRAVYVLCADNGVVRQGVTQTGSEVTAVVARNLTVGDTSVCRMAMVANADVIPVDMGMLEDLKLEKLLNHRIAPGTGDISQGPAMSREQALAAIDTGIRLVEQAKNSGCRLLCAGEMGIGNTTTSAAMASVLLGCDPSEVTGRGAGLSTSGLEKKVRVIRQAIALNRPDPADPVDILAKLGGFDIAGMAGIYIGGRIHRIPVILDGLISCVAALTAVRLCPDSLQALIASHVSAEPAGQLLLEKLGLAPLVTAGMFLGEGSGAVSVLPLLDMAYAVYRGMPTFRQTNLEPYRSLT